jgi:hypothetical protein
MPQMRKSTRSKVPGSKSVDRYVRLLNLRDGPVREVAAALPAPTPPVPRSPVPKAAKPVVQDAAFNGEHQAMLCLYLNLLTSKHSEVDISTEFWRCYRHLLEGGSMDDLPVRIVNLPQLLEEVALVQKHEAHVLDDPPKKRKEHDDDRKHPR